MSPAQGLPSPPVHETPVIPPIPSAFRKGRARSAPAGDRRWLIWAAALLVGVGLGVGAYQWVPNLDGFFDFVFCLAFGA